MYTGPNISDSGLILCLDAANAKSYVNGSTVWNDLSRNGNNGTLTNGPTFDSSNLGSIVFDGVDDYIQLSFSPNVLTQITCESFLKPDSSNITGPYVTGWIMGIELNYRLLYSSASVSWVCAAGNPWYSVGTYANSNIEYPINNNWVHLVGTYNGSYNSVYLNGLLIATGSNITGNIASGGNFYIGKGISNVANQKGKGAVYRVYNRALSPQEILQNYEGLKSRYGL